MAGPYDNIREGAMNPPAGTAAGYEDMLWNQMLGASQQEEQRYLQSLRDTSNRAIDRSGWYNVGSMLMPHDAGDVALSVAMGPGVGRIGRAALAGLGGMLTQPSEAEGSLFVRAQRALESGVMGRHGSRDIERHMRDFPRVADAAEPTVQRYLDNMRNVLESPGPQMRMFEDPIDFIQGNREPAWMLALNPQRNSLTPYGHSMMDSSRHWTPGQEQVTNVGTLLQDQRIAQMYPGLEDVPVRISGPNPTAMGSYTPGQPGWQGSTPEINLYGANAHWSPAERRGTWTEELQHSIQDLDNRLSPTANWNHALTFMQPDEIQALSTRFGGPNNLEGRLYRAQPVEWEAGLANNRAQQRVSVPRWFPDIQSNSPDDYWRLFAPEFHGP